MEFVVEVIIIAGGLPNFLEPPALVAVLSVSMSVVLSGAKKM
jgi:hypothetical protein